MGIASGLVDFLKGDFGDISQEGERTNMVTHSQ